MVPSNTIIDNGNERYESTKSHIAETSVHSLLNLGMDVFGDEKSSYPRRRNYYRDGDLPLLTCSPRAAAPSPPPLSRCSFDRQEAGPEDPQSGRWWNPPGRDLAIGASGTVVGGGIDGGGGEEGAEGGAVLSGLAPLLWPALSSFFEVAAAGVEDGDTGGVLVEILEQVALLLLIGTEGVAEGVVVVTEAVLAGLELEVGFSRVQFELGVADLEGIIGGASHGGTDGRERKRRVTVGVEVKRGTNLEVFWQRVPAEETRRGRSANSWEVEYVELRPLVTSGFDNLFRLLHFKRAIYGALNLKYPKLVSSYYHIQCWLETDRAPLATLKVERVPLADIQSGTKNQPVLDLMHG